MSRQLLSHGKFYLDLRGLQEATAVGMADGWAAGVRPRRLRQSACGNAMGVLVALAGPVTKWAKEVRRGKDVGQALRRASLSRGRHPP